MAQTSISPHSSTPLWMGVGVKRILAAVRIETFLWKFENFYWAFHFWKSRESVMALTLTLPPRPPPFMVVFMAILRSVSRKYRCKRSKNVKTFFIKVWWIWKEKRKFFFLIYFIYFFWKLDFFCKNLKKIAKFKNLPLPL